MSAPQIQIRPAVAAIIKLAWTFHTLEHLDPESWDIDDFMDPIGKLSPGERHVRIFIANVWNPGYAQEQGWKFDAMDACATWDTRLRSAYAAWARNPVWP